MMPRPPQRRRRFWTWNRSCGGGTRSATLRDPNVSDHKTTFAQLEAMAPHIRWSDYFEHLQLRRTLHSTYKEPKFLQEVDRQMQKCASSGLEDVLEVAATELRRPQSSKEFCGREFCLKRQYLNGATEK